MHFTGIGVQEPVPVPLPLRQEALPPQRKYAILFIAVSPHMQDIHEPKGPFGR